MMKSRFIRLMMIVFFCNIAACQSLSQGAAPQPGFTAYYVETASHYLEMATTAPSPEKQNLELKAAGRLLQDRSFVKAQELLSRIEVSSLPNTIQTEKWLMNANLAALQQLYPSCIIALHKITEPKQLVHVQKIAYYQLLATCQAASGHFWESAEARIALDQLLSSEAAHQENRQTIWSDLNRLSTFTLNKKLSNTPYGQMQGWLELVYINRQYVNDPALLNQERRQWQLKFPQHPANILFSPSQKELTISSLLHPSTVAMPHQAMHIALLLPTTGQLASSAQAIQNGFTAASTVYQQTNAPVTIQTYNTQETHIPTLYKQAVANGANLVVGPLTKADVEMLENSSSLAVPTLALNFTINNAKSTQNLYEYALSPQDEAYQVAKKMIAQSYHRVLVITPKGQWGDGIASTFKQSFTNLGGEVVDSMTYSGDLNSKDKSIKQFLKVSDEARNRKKTEATDEKASKSPRREDADAIFLVATPQDGRQLKPLLNFYYAGNLPVYATSHIYTGIPNPIRDKDLDGIRFCDTPWALNQGKIVQEAKEQLQLSKTPTPAQKTRLYAFGYDAFQLATHLSPFTLHQGFLSGTTGKLYLNNHQVYRQLSWAQFRNGSPKPIN